MMIVSQMTLSSRQRIRISSSGWSEAEHAKSQSTSRVDGEGIMFLLSLNTRTRDEDASSGVTNRSVNRTLYGLVYHQPPVPHIFGFLLFIST